jgi:hypothetical protein
MLSKHLGSHTAFTATLTFDPTWGEGTKQQQLAAYPRHLLSVGHVVVVAHTSVLRGEAPTGAQASTVMPTAQFFLEQLLDAFTRNHLHFANNVSESKYNIKSLKPFSQHI